MAEPCPVCGARVPPQSLEAHVNAHFEAPPGNRHPQETDASVALCSFPDCKQYVALGELDRHEEHHRQQKQKQEQQRQAATSAGQATAPAPGATNSHDNDDDDDVIILPTPHKQPAATGPSAGGSDPAAQPACSAAPGPGPGPGSGSGVSCVLCPYGCGQWVPLHELDSHELMHALQQQQQQRQGRAPGAAGPESADPDDADDYGSYGLTGADDAYREDWALAAAQQAAEEEEEAAARALQEQSDYEELRAKYGFSTKRPGRCFHCQQEGHWARDCPSNPRVAAARARGPLSREPALLLAQQTADPQFRPGVPRLLAALKACLESSAAVGYEAYLCSPVAHFSAQAGDRGWGCGWRNIQMLASGLLAPGWAGAAQLQPLLFGGAGFVPDIASLQAWLEAAWAGGYDPLGCESLGGRIQGDPKWIGTTEAAALLRFFGARACIVDFVGHGAAGVLGVAPPPVHGPDGALLHPGVQCDLCGEIPMRGTRYRSTSRPDYDVCAACRQLPPAAAAEPYIEVGASGLPSGPQEGDGPAGHSQAPQMHQLHLHQPLVDWVWRYFTGQHQPTSHMFAPHGGGSGSAGAGGAQQVGALGLRSSPVTLTGLPPLYFQHEGHSRTIIGIERRPTPAPAAARAAGGPSAPGAGSSSGPLVTLLVLDPGVPAGALAGALAARRQWAKYVRRGLHTLTKAQYQLLYVMDSPAASAQEREQAKVMRATEVYRAPAA